MVKYLIMNTGTLADTLKARRKQLGYSQAGLAQTLGVSLQSVWRWEKGLPISQLALERLRARGIQIEA